MLVDVSNCSLTGKFLLDNGINAKKFRIDGGEEKDAVLMTLLSFWIQPCLKSIPPLGISLM